MNNPSLISDPNRSHDRRGIAEEVARTRVGILMGELDNVDRAVIASNDVALAHDQAREIVDKNYVQPIAPAQPAQERVVGQMVDQAFAGAGVTEFPEADTTMTQLQNQVDEAFDGVDPIDIMRRLSEDTGSHV